LQLLAKDCHTALLRFWVKWCQVTESGCFLVRNAGALGETPSSGAMIISMIEWIEIDHFEVAATVIQVVTTLQEN
jgi:hypothetical protein